MKNPDETVDRARKMDVDQLIAAAGLRAPISLATFLYVSTDGEIESMEIGANERPADMYTEIGFVARMRGGF